MTEVEKIIYNNFLEVSKKVNNKPVKYRKNFDNFPNSNISPNIIILFLNSKKLISDKRFIEAIMDSGLAL